ncbi:MAG: type 4a pilus biogenesis protein PilO [Planctomycetaceae bacterium]|nr:type 4a pilus biogenesis protein PilO [Planctomycetaceae bacterium]
MKFGPRELVILVLLAAIPFGAWQFVFRPQNAHNERMRTEINAKQQKLKAINQAVATIGSLRKEIAELSKAVEFFQSKLPNEKEIDKVLQEIWRTAETNRLSTKSIRTLPRKERVMTEQGMSPAEQPIAVQLDGDFMGLYAFLQALENQPRIMQIRSMTLNKPDGAAEGAVSTDLVMSVFFEGGTGGRP